MWTNGSDLRASLIFPEFPWHRFSSRRLNRQGALSFLVERWLRVREEEVNGCRAAGASSGKTQQPGEEARLLADYKRDRRRLNDPMTDHEA